MKLEQFVVKNYCGDDGPTIKGNGFDGFRIGGDREDAEEFVKFLNDVCVHAVNVHDDLVAALRDLVARCDGAEGVRDDGSNIQTIQAHVVLAKAETA